MKFSKYIYSLIFAICTSGFAGAQEAKRYVGGDISLLPDYEAAGAKYKDSNGQPISDVLKFCSEEGMNIMRVRLFVNPDDYTGKDKDANAKQDLDYILPLCKRIKEDGLALMLDFHYSDTWADPANQWTPKAWEDLSDEELYVKIYDYTKECLEILKENGVVPDYIQPGNEISYGMLWGKEGSSDPLKVYTSSDANWERFATLLKNAIKACGEVCPDAKIIIHSERVSQSGVLLGFYRKLDALGVDYDIIGLSYYPYFHGSISGLNNSLAALELQFPEREIMLVETGYSYAWEVPGTNQKVDYPYSEEGQARFAQDLVDTLLKHPQCRGLLWWWMEYNAYGTTLSGWYNAPLFDSRNGKVTKAFSILCSFARNGDDGVISVFDAEKIGTGVWYDLHGRELAAPTMPGLYIHSGKKVIVR